MSSFFASYRRRFNLDEVLREWQAEQEVQAGTTEEGKGVAAAGGGVSGSTEDEEVRRAGGRMDEVCIIGEVYAVDVELM